MNNFILLFLNFVLRLFFQKEELQLKSPKFNPVKVLAFFILVVHTVLFYVLLNKTLKLYDLYLQCSKTL